MNDSIKSWMWYCCSTVIVVVGSKMGYVCFLQNVEHPGHAVRRDFASAMASWDGEWYVRIASDGYSWNSLKMSNVAFFPAYPTLGALAKWVTGWRTDWALLSVTHVSLVGSFVLLGKYIAERFAEGTFALQEYSLVALGLFPTTFWMRMCYTESLFLLIVLIAMFGMLRNWSPVWVAFVIGFATATRSTGIALLPVYWWWLWRDREQPGETAGSIQRGTSFRSAAKQLVVYLPICIWGLLAYMLFLYATFGEPLAFMQTQQHWDERTLAGLGEKLLKLITLEPFWAVYLPSSPCYWGRVPSHDNPLFNLKFWNPIYVLLTIGLLILGARRRWLNGRELLLAAGLLAIPLWFQATRACMMSQARYASVIFPVYMVMGQILTRLPSPLVGMLCAISGVMLAIYSALFVSWYWFY